MRARKVWPGHHAVEITIDNSGVDTPQDRIGSIRMRSNSGFSPWPCRADSVHQAAMLKITLRLLLTAILAPCLFAVPAGAQATSTYVSRVGSDANPCTAASPCRTLQAAVARTAPGGQILPLDSANYGYVTIRQAVSILNGRGATGVLATSSLTRVNIQAGANDVVTMQGLDIDGAGSGASGIQFTSGASLNIQDSVIRGFTNGINFQPRGSGTLLVSKTLLSNNSTGINLHSAAASTAVLDDVQLVNNGIGLAALGASGTAPTSATVQNSLIANNSTAGVVAGAFSAVSVANSTLTSNLVGVQAQAASSTLNLSNTTAAGNKTAWQAANGGQVLSASNNAFGGNLAGNNGPPAATPPPPTAIAKNIVTDFGAKCDGVANDNAAFTAFNNWGRAQTLPITLTIPSDSVCMFTNTTGSGNWFAKGIKNLLVMGYGAMITDNNGAGNGFFLGGTGVIQDNAHSSRVMTVLSGSTTVRLNNKSESNRFHVGNWALMAGIDLMGYGFPNNPAVFEYVQIMAVNSSTGVINFSTPLKNTYKSTWPLYNAGSRFEVDQGGPATLYALDPSWDTEVEYRGLTISQVGQTYANGRSITYRDVIFTGYACGIPTQNMRWQVINTDMSSCNMEVDKIIDTLVFRGGTIHQVIFQSASVNSFTMDGTTITSALNGTPITSLISNANIASFKPGAIAYGVSQETACISCVIGDLPIGGFIEQNINTNFTMINGVLKVPNAHGPVTWALPGANLIWSGQYLNEGSFTVIDVTQDATNTYIYTSLTGGFPNLPLGGGTTLAIRTHPAPKFTCTNCSGSAAAVDFAQAPPGAPIYSYTKRTYLGSIRINQPQVTIWGKMVSVKLNVTSAYIGTPNPLMLEAIAQFGTQVIKSDGSFTYYDPFINWSIAGERDVTPSGVTGQRSGDSGLPVPEAVWFANTVAPSLTTNIGSCVSACPAITIEIATDQGIHQP
jgi:hypothetical protein